MYNREGFYVDIDERECTICGCMFPITIGSSMCKPCNNDRVKSQSTATKMRMRAKSRSKIKGIPFDIDVSDIKIPDTCPILDIPIFVTKGRSGAFRNSPSLDRIVPELGYVKGNVQVISQQANAMKGCASKEDMLSFAKWVLEVYGVEDENYEH